MTFFENMLRNNTNMLLTVRNRGFSKLVMSLSSIAGGMKNRKWVIALVKQQP